MCVNSQQVTLFDLLGQSTQSSEDSPVSPGPSQEISLEQMTPDTFGQNTTGLSKNCGHGGSLERTCPVCYLAELTPSSQTLKRKTTPAGRSYWVLTMSARRIDANEYSLSQDWPTPMSRDWKDEVTQGNRKSPNLGPTVLGLPGQVKDSLTGKVRERLNPKWVAQLMGLPANFLDGVKAP
jgi:hypothetical protein